jgi:hypothetical protein
MAFEVTPADEGRHAPGDEMLWGESWYHDFAAQDGSYGGYLRLGLYPNQEIAWYWVHLVRNGQPLVVIRDHAVPGPKEMDGPVSVESPMVRGTWQPVEPLRSYRITTEGTGVALADPVDAFHGEQGTEVAVRLDLTWEGVAPCFPYAATTRFEQSAWVSGEMVIGDERIEVRCPGQRDHSWGVRDWWLFPWVWCSGRLDDGTWWHCARSALPKAELFQTGYVVSPDGELREATTIGLDYELDGEQLPTSATITVGELELRLTPELHAPVLLVSPEGKESRFPRAMVVASTPDGRVGHGWLEFNFPEGVEHLKS